MILRMVAAVSEGLVDYDPSMLTHHFHCSAPVALSGPRSVE